LSKKRSSSTRKGMTRVLFFSAATSTTVCSSRSCKAAGLVLGDDLEAEHLGRPIPGARRAGLTGAAGGAG
jgi:hypothetical protein